MVKRGTRTDKYQETRENPDNSLKDIDSALNTIKTGVETSALKENINEQFLMLNTVKSLYLQYNSLRDNIRWAEWNGNTKRQLRHQLNENIQDLERIWNNLWWDKKSLKKSLKNPNEPIKTKKNAHVYSDLTQYEHDIWELVTYYNQYEQACQTISLWWTTSNIHTVIRSKQDARAARSYEKSDAKYQQSMNEILHSAAITSLWNNDMERYEEYLKLVVNWQIEPSSHPFYKAHEQSFNQLRNTNPSLYQALVPSWAWRTQYRVVVWAPESWTISWSAIRTASQSESFPSRLWKWFGELLWNIFPSIENNPRQKQAREQAGSVLALWWAIFMWFKILKKVFSSKEKNPNKLRDAALRWWWLLSLANWDKIIRCGKDWVQNAFNRHPAEKIQASAELFQKYWLSDTDALKYSEMQVWAPVALMSALHFVPIYDLNAQKIIEYKNNEFQFNYDNYKNYIDNYNRTAEQKKIVLDAWKQLKEDNVTDLAFIWLGIKDWNQLNWLAHWSETKTLADCPEIQEAWLENSELLKSPVNQILFNQWLTPIDTEAQKQIVKEYNAHWWENIRKESELKQLIILRMREWLLKINGEVQYDLENMIKDPNIDLEKKTMKWFENDWWNKIPFDSYKELFDIVWLTQRIKQNFKNKPTAHGNIGDIFKWIKDDEPFHVNIKFPKDRWHIEFNNKEFWSIYWDTDVLKSWTLRKISDTLKWNKQFYCDYLNKRRKKDWKYWRM